MPGQVIETRSGSVFIPGQVLYISSLPCSTVVRVQVIQTDSGMKFVPGQIVETESGAVFVPGQVGSSPVITNLSPLTSYCTILCR